MKTLEMYQVDAFATAIFKGNPAAVCILNTWLPDALMQDIAMENNLSETAFAVPIGDGFSIRWFTPETEVALCGHATLATAHVLFNEVGLKGNTIRFESRERGTLAVNREGEWLVLDFPADPPAPVKIPIGLSEAMGVEPLECLQGSTDYLLIFDKAATVDNLEPDFSMLKQIKGRGVIASAPGLDVDFVSRFFAPQSGINEDPVTGSAHTLLVPYWARRLGKESLEAEQHSARGGYLRCEARGPRVSIGGKAKTYMKGTIYLPN